MKTLGILGGMSWESTQHLYALINRDVAARLGGLHSAQLVLHSVDFAPIAAQQAAGDWAGAARVLGEAAAGLRRAGAEALLIATNTMHRVAAEVEQAAGLPVLHIVDSTADALRAAGVKRAGLLATRFTMEQAFYRERLWQRHGIEAITPDEAGRAEVHRLIYEELCRGRFEAASREWLRDAVGRLADRGAQAVILGCTELGLLLPAGAAAAVPLFDSTELQARAAVDWMLG
ncbi:aspartate/glutamate racemase family protein [Roseateles puraquae]|uniref:Aspartate/glutamate racemase n=1 Tax=Roseateles puraquae TaxID=431059 RepID=A0A254N9K9_9BURK|nr:aspartate/glutamate racemase family protein [Roseateles puraquae]MDG0855630.1 aspartate/glutamate racemase family protein [Roseateles puraquae]OWR04675.1 aspartate/glutamate racemase [Roseateles puraquae]